MSPRIAITSGEPAGIGPDIILSALQDNFAAQLVVVGDPELFRQRAQQLGLDLEIKVCSDLTQITDHRAGQVQILPTLLGSNVECGKLDVANAPYVLETLRITGQGCLDGDFDAVVTPPVHKGVLCETGVHFSGHTEFFQDLCNSPQVVMMLASQAMRVALVTTHLPLKDIPAAITPDTIRTVTRALHQDLKTRFGCDQPRILVCGLNPHAGEDGHLGREEIEIITPTLNELREEGMSLIGPLPADTLFQSKYLEQADCVLAMYHDQGLPVLKYSGFGNAVNITLGLPIIRTSVDHGTALDLAGTGQASDGSLKVAIENAITMATNAQKRH
ncbi:4-hydroxythreonine-4-phosphate dehydrogenase PdxA [Marinomonas communis]|uniref:4-hydroxythreonine-4-phosphate dehydrogenase PdxA n=1 Tax=Marinomonas communis TaxID=28254 RepID=UPI001D188773|nr:4-hydroxythreonine-4-phosphate dehydrogenase PdxA [Marinomonas communis]MCC4273219.1 4-hydroxythreonine-4-phosphate dehydrogenase PdxA [Marinomonas communis]